MRRFVKDGLVRPSKVPVNECSQAMYPAKIGYSFGYDTPRANHLKRHPANESSPEMSPQCSTVTKLVHEILSRHTVTKYAPKSHTARWSQKYLATATIARQTRATLATECMIRNANKRVFVVALARFRCRFCTKLLLSILLRRTCTRFRDRWMSTVLFIRNRYGKHG